MLALGRRVLGRLAVGRRALRRRGLEALVLGALLAMGGGGLYALAAAVRPPPSVTGVGEAGAGGRTGAAVVALPGAVKGRAAVPADPAGGRVWPLEGRPPVLRGWKPPAGPYGPGHRGVDLGAGPGTPVRAAASGRVSFAGGVAGRGVVVIELAGTGDPPLRTTYEPVRPLVAKGDEVTAGQVVAVLAAGPFHCASGCLHWGLRRAEAYVDPLSLLPPSLLRRGPSRLLPVSGVPLPGPS